MLRSLEVSVLILAILACVLAVRAHRLSAGSGQARWGARAGFLLSASMLVGTVPELFFPSVPWFRWSGLLLSFVLLGASMALLRRQVRALRS